MQQILIATFLCQGGVSKKIQPLPPRRSSLFIRLVGGAVTRFENLSTGLFLR